VQGVAVVGSGLGGLALAATLQARGVQAQLIDGHLDSPVGLPDRGLCLWGGALSALDHLGLRPALMARGVSIERVQVWAARGRLLVDLPAREQPVGGLCLRHAALIEVLAAACANVPFERGQQVISYEESDQSVELAARSGRTFRATVAVAADGPRSLVRAQCLEDGPPSYSGDTVWQGITVGLRRLDPGTLHLYWSPGGVRGGFMAVDRAGNWLWWVDCAASAGGTTDGRAAKAALRGLLCRVRGPLLDLVESTPDAGIRRADVYARHDPGGGGRGRIGLVGDAWHPVPISLRLGGTLAIEDGVALGESLATEPNPVHALRAMERAREPRISFANQTLWKLRGVEATFSPTASWVRDRLMRLAPRSSLQRVLMRLLTGEEPARPHESPHGRLRWA
jgi:salicylate hydroxylase